MFLKNYLPLILTVFAVAAGWYLHHDGYNQGVEYTNAVCKKAAAELILEQEQTLRREYQAQIQRANASVKKLRQQKRIIQARANDLQKEIGHVTQRYRPQPAQPPQPLPECIFTHGFVRLYNQSITRAKLPATDIAARTDGKTRTAATTKTDPLSPSPIQQADILNHIGVYGGRCLKIEAQLNGLIDHLNKQQTERG